MSQIPCGRVQASDAPARSLRNASDPSSCASARDQSKPQVDPCKRWLAGLVIRSTPAASADEADDMLMVVNFFPAATTPLPRHMGETGLERPVAHPNHHPTFSHSPPLRAHAAVPAAAAHQPPSSRACRRTAAEAARLPARADHGQVGGGGPRGRRGGRTPRSALRPPATAHAGLQALWASSVGC